MVRGCQGKQSRYVRRDNSKIFVSMDNLAQEVDKILEDIQIHYFPMLRVSRENTFLPKDYGELSDILNNQRELQNQLV